MRSAKVLASTICCWVAWSLAGCSTGGGQQSGATGGGMLDGITSIFKPAAKGPDSTSGASGSAQTEQSGSAQAEQSGSADSADSGSNFKLEKLYKKSTTVFDPTCKNLILPFDLSGNLAVMTQLGIDVAKENLGLNFGTADATTWQEKLKLGGKNLNWLPADTERMLGEQLHQKQASLMIPDANAPSVKRANTLLKNITTNIKEPLPYRLDIYVRSGGGTNAHALPGGIIHIDQGLLNSPKREDLAYFALAHELAHVLQRHETRSTQARLTDSIDSFAGLQKIISTAQNAPKGMLAYTNELMTRFVTFSQNQELQADACAVRMLNSVFNDPKHLAKSINDFEVKLGPAPPADPKSMYVVDTWVQNVGEMGKLDDQHPNSTVRAANLQKMARDVLNPPAQKKDQAPIKVIKH